MCIRDRSKPVPLTDAEMAPLGIQRDDIVVDFEVGDTIQVIAGAWADTDVYKRQYEKREKHCGCNLYPSHGASAYSGRLFSAAPFW